MTLAASVPSRTLRNAIDSGLNGRDLIKAADLTFPAFRKPLGGSVTVSRPFRRAVFETDAAFLEGMVDIMASGRSALILNVSTPTYSHWTVASSVTPQAIVLRDSGTMMELDLERYSIKRGRYRIKPQETLLVHMRPRRTPMSEGG